MDLSWTLCLTRDSLKAVRPTSTLVLTGLALISIVSSIIIYFMTGLRSGADHFFIFFADLLLSLVRLGVTV